MVRAPRRRKPHDLARLRADVFPEHVPRPARPVAGRPGAGIAGSGRWTRPTSATSPPTGTAPWTTPRSAAAPAWCCGRTWSMRRWPRSPTTARVVCLTPRGRALHPGRRRSASPPAPGVDPAVRPLRGHRPARHRGARDGGSLSIGDYVLSGGELAALVLLDAVVRLLPGVMGAADSATDESFAAGLLEYPHYTRPAEWQGRRVPDVLLSGHHGAVAAWRRAEAERITRERRPDLWAAIAPPTAPPGCQPGHGALSNSPRRTSPMNIVQQFEAERDRPPQPGPRRARIPGRRHRPRRGEGGGRRAHPHPGVRGRLHRPLQQGPEQQLHGAQDQLRRGRGARVPAVFAD